MVPKEAYGIAALLAGAVTLYCTISYTPPYAWVADAQIAWFHANIVNVSFWATFLLTTAPLVVAIRVAEKRLGTRQTWLSPVWDNLDHILDHLPGKGMLIGGTLVVTGIYFGAKDFARGGLSHLSVAALEQGTAPSSGFVQLDDGALVAEANISFREGGITYHYYPVVVNPGGPPRLYVRTADASPSTIEQPIRGRLDQNGIPGEIEGQLRTARMIGETYYLVSEGTKPDVEFTMWTVAIGLLVIALSIVWWRVGYAPRSPNHGGVAPR